MTEARSSPWRGILGRAAISEPPHAGDDHRIVRHPQAGVTAMWNRIIVARNKVIEIGIEIDRQAMAYGSAMDELLQAQGALSELMKDLDAKVEFVNPFPQIEPPSKRTEGA